MFQVRKSTDRGHADHGWLNAKHSFSFASYLDRNFMGFRALRVINEDKIAGGKGFGTHPHNDMEILTYILEGELAHKDSMGNGRTIKAGEVQGMSAGTGVTHSEFNALEDRETHLLQIWIQPHTKGVKPSYSEWLPKGKNNLWQLTASETGQDGSIIIHQDAKMFVATTDQEVKLLVNIAHNRFGWLQIGKGSAMVNDVELKQGDGLAFSGDTVKELVATAGSEILLFDLA